MILNAVRRRFAVDPPHVNFSRYECTREGDGITVGLCAVRGMGPRWSERIVKEREERGPFLSVPDFLRRVKPPQRLLRTLMRIGALDGLDKRKAA